MITPAMIYWVGILDEIKDACNGGVLYLLIFVFSTGFFWLMSLPMTDETSDNKKNRILKKVVCIGICLLLLCYCTKTFLPSSRLAAAMYMVPAIANNENVQAIGSNSLEALRLLTEDWLRDLADAKKSAQSGQGSAL